MEQKVGYTKRTKTPEQALQSLMRMCARSERSSGDAMRLMKRWGVADEDARKVLLRLQNERFIDTILETPVTLDSWRHFHNLVRTADQPSFDLGFATFFLSRTNRSGILTAGPIGGSTEEKQETANSVKPKKNFSNPLKRAN